MLKNCPKKLVDWITLIILLGTICSAAFAGTSKLLVLILEDQFKEIYNRISCLETNQKVLNVQIEGINGTVNKIWYRVK